VWFKLNRLFTLVDAAVDAMRISRVVVATQSGMVRCVSKFRPPAVKANVERARRGARWSCSG
jgi:hypothetical protein